MIKVTYLEVNKQITFLEVKGHAYSGDPGKDLVCSAVSAITFGGLNALSQKVKITVKEDAHVTIKVSEKVTTKDYIILETLLTQLKTIAHSYPQNIKIIRKESEKNDL